MARAIRFRAIVRVKSGPPKTPMMSPSPVDKTPQEITVIEAGRSAVHYWNETWRARELLFFFAWRDIIVRYKQTLAGIAWIVFRPVMTMIVFTIVFGHIAKLPATNTPYPLLVFSGLLPWQFFGTAVTDASNSLLTNSALISKVYFPRLIAPLSAIAVNIVDFLVAMAIMAALMAWYQAPPPLSILFLPIPLAILFALTSGISIALSALNARYRDAKLLIPFFVQFGLYVSPVGFSSSVIPTAWRFAYMLNPMVGIIEGFRWCLLDQRQPFPGASIAIAASTSIFVLLMGGLYFRSQERGLADVI